MKEKKEKDNIEEKENFLKELKIFSKTNYIIVEGKKDKKVLEEFGIKCYSMKGNIDLFVEKIILEKEVEKKENKSYKPKVAILTDYDYRGEKIKSILKENFSRQGIEEEKKYRIKLKKIFKINHIESLKLF